MDKLSDIEFVGNSFLLKPKRHSYCFDKCFTAFEREVTYEQRNCISKKILI